MQACSFLVFSITQHIGFIAAKKLLFKSLRKKEPVCIRIFKALIAHLLL
jgi:hypothetical protein